MRHVLTSLLLMSLLGCSKDEPISFDKLTLTNVGINSAAVSIDLSKELSADIIEMGLCWSTNPLPTRSRDQVVLLKKAGQKQVSDSISGLSFDTYYYVRAFIKTSLGLKYSNEVLLKTLKSPYSIGQAVGNGFIYHIDSTGLHGMIASRKIGHSLWTAWWDGFKYKYIGTSIAFGKGQENTKKINQGFWLC